eukprot:16434826-Heterocapsa_arctica.AAC.1
MRGTSAPTSRQERPSSAPPSQRISAAIATTKKIKRTGYSYEKKASMIRMASLPKALYGTEAAPVCDRSLGILRSCIAATIAPTS